MAEEQTEKKQEEKTANKPANTSSGKMVWILAAAIAIISAGGGYGVSMLSANTSLNFFKPSVPAPSSSAPQKLTIDNPTGKEATWYYKLDPVVANLDEPGALRYIRLAVYLEMDASAQQDQCQKLIDAKKPMLINWLQLYLAGRSLEEVKGERYLKTMQIQILEGFNQILFPNTKSLIKGVLFGELNIQ